ncbi:MAG: hypothetical protein AAGA32_18425 [Pseudomonadota bacterium]
MTLNGRGLLLWAACLAALATPFAWREGPFGGGGGGQAGAGTLTDAEARDVLRARLADVYGAFGQTEEFAIYDGIARAVTPSLTTDLYLQRRQAQMVEETWGAPTEILAFDLTAASMVGQDASRIHMAAEWQVTGQVGHGDHTHERTNAYAARVTLARAEGEWRLSAFNLDRIVLEEIVEDPLFFGGFE